MILETVKLPEITLEQLTSLKYIDYLIFSMPKSAKTVAEFYKIEFESFENSLKRAEKVGIKQIEYINGEKQKWYEILNEPENSHILNICQKSFSEVKLLDESFLHLMNFLEEDDIEDDYKDIAAELFTKQIIGNPQRLSEEERNLFDKSDEYEKLSQKELVSIWAKFYGISEKSMRFLNKCYLEMIKVWNMNQHFERIVALNPDSSFDKDYVKIPIKIRDVRKGREVDLGQIHYSIIIHYFMKSRIFLENSENLPDTSSSKAMQILTGFDSENMRKQLGKLDFSKGDLNVVKEKLEKVNQLIVKELDKK